jgi:excinuclease UvrABC nuclease subunit
MQQKAKNLEFESASKIKTYIESISIIEENQIVRDKIN